MDVSKIPGSENSKSKLQCNKFYHEQYNKVKYEDRYKQNK